MREQDKKTMYVAAGLSLLFFLFFQIFGALSENQNPVAEKFRLSDILNSPMNVDSAFNAGKGEKSKFKKDGFSFSKGITAQRPLVAQAKPQVPPKTELKKIDPKKKPKKKAKKKTPEVSVVVVSKPQERAFTPTEERPTSAAGAFAPNKKEEEKRLRTEDEWISYLSINPSIEKFDEFREAYRAGEVDRGMYFSVAVALLEFGNEEVNRTGLSILASVPGPEAFYNLALVSDSHQNRSIRSKARISLNAYSSLNFLNLIHNLLGNQDAVVRYYAALTIEKSAIRNLVPTEVTGPNGRPIRGRDGTDPTTEPGFTIVRNVTRYLPVRQTLRNLESSDKNGDVRDIARSAGATIDRLIGGSPINVGSSGPPTPGANLAPEAFEQGTVDSAITEQ